MSVLLHQTVQALHALHRCSEPADSVPLLRRAYGLLCQLLRLAGPPHKLAISTAYFPTTTVFYHSSQSETEDSTDVTYSNVFQYLRDYGNGQESSPYSQLIQSLNSQTADPVISALRTLLRNLEFSHESAQDSLIEYLSQCFTHELSYFASLRSQIDDTDQNTDEMLSALHTYVQKSARHPGHNPKLESDPAFPLAMDASDPDFTKAYNILLQLALCKSPSDPDTWSYAEVVVKYFKNARGIVAFGSEPQTENFLHFFCGSSGLVAPQLRDFAKPELEMLVSGRVSSHNLEEMPLGEPAGPDFNRGISSPVQDLSDVANTSISKSFTNEDLTELISQFKTLISLFKGFDPTFDESLAYTFRYYVHLVYEKDHQLSTNADFEFIDQLVEVIRSVVELEVTGRDSDLKLLQEAIAKLRWLQNELSDAQSSQSLLLRSAISDWNRIASTRRKYLRQWNYQTLELKQLKLYSEQVHSAGFGKGSSRTLFTKWYNRAMTFDQLHSQAAQYSDQKVVLNAFNKFWIRKMIRHIDMRSQAEHFVVRRIFSKWRKKGLQIQELEDRSDKQYRTFHLRKAFDQLLLEQDRLDDMNSQAIVLADQFRYQQKRKLLVEVVSTWKSRLNDNLNSSDIAITTKFQRLDSASRQFVMRKFFGVLRARSSNSKNRAAFEKFRDRELKKRAFALWSNKIGLHRKESAFVSATDLRLKMAAFASWHRRTKSRSLADATLKKKLLKKYFKTLKLKHRAHLAEDGHRAVILSRTLQDWRNSLKSSNFRESNDVYLAQICLHEWIRRSSLIQDLSNEADNQSMVSSKRKALVGWKAKMDLCEFSESMANLNVQRTFWNKYRARVYRKKQQIQKAEHFSSDKIQLEQRLTLRASLRTWQDAYMDRYERGADEAIRTFQKSFRERRSKKLFLRHWRKKTDDLQDKAIVLERNLELFNKTSTLKTEIFVQWTEKAHQISELVDDSDKFYDNVLHKRFLLIWFDKFYRKSRQLSEIAEDRINSRDYDQLVRVLKRWKFVYNKNVKSKIRACDDYIETRNRANVRSLFELWRYKYQQKTDTHDELFDANTSFGSNTSPLARKFPSARSTESFGESYLHTPVKKQIERTPFTPFRSGPSPTRLQETTQRLKYSKMEAMTDRYRKAVASKQPRLRPSGNTSLPPPRSNMRSGQIAIRPPPAPRFESYYSDTSSPEATSSPSEQPMSTFQNSVALTSPESEMYETAKERRRIKPIVIPTDDEGESFVYSPVSKLRERMLAKRGSPRRSEAAG